MPEFSPNIIFLLFLGLILGSFCTALIYRVPRKISWGMRRSACPQCGVELKLRDLFPVFSWLLARGKCRSCKKPIGKLYPLVEIFVMLACLGAYWSFGLTPTAAVLIFCIPFLVALIVIDLQHGILPDQLVFAVGVLAILRLAGEVFYAHSLTPQDALTQYICGGIAYGAFAWTLAFVMRKALKKEALGFGDIKFFIVAGLWLGLIKLGWFCVLSGMAGVAMGILWKVLKKGDVFPFGPALIFSLYLLLILGSTFFP